ncbi:hypothetical protein [Pelosinus sp. IPA-1]|uniref:hypothetical protein n=1 Tax=Pelosinus sp. IPA-1 TaxID=3029569 RepID=UPI0024361989|nr:hypothetical protein [Pelosinus sp. IPA-1]GMB01847.1 hypothetical protein PIPA1_46470 [Pelosinus sp. IPA-1]
MNLKRIVIFFILLLLAVIVNGCANNKEMPTSSEKGFNPVYTVLGEKDVSTGYAVRRIIRISVPLGLEKKVLEDNIQHAARDVEKRYAKADRGLAIDVYTFTDEDVKLLNQGEYVNTIADCTYAPNGEWTNSNIKYSPSNMKANITIKDDYFKKQKK